MNGSQESGDSAQALTVDSAASVLAGLLSDDSEEQQPADAQSSDETPEAPSLSEEEQGDAPASEEQSEEPEEESPSDEDDDAPETASQQPETHRLKVDGADIEVTLDELKRGYSRNEDYTRKTQKLADDRRKFDAEIQPEREAVRADRQRYAEHITQLENALKSLTQEPDWDTLRRENPDLFADTWAAWDQHQKRIAQISQEREKAFAAVQDDALKQHQARLADERTKLIAAIPTWADEKVAKKESDDLISYGKTLGFGEDELRGVSDHRALVALRKAMLFDNAEAAKAAAKKAAQSKIEKVTVAPPGSAAKAKPKVTELTKARQRHAKVGSVDSAAEALSLMLDD